MPISLSTLIRYLRDILKSQYRITKTQQFVKRDISTIIRIINLLYTDVMPHVNKDITKSHRETSCNVCYEQFNYHDTEQIILRTCGHQHICINCFQQYITMKVTENENLYIRCPHEGCKHAVDTHDVLLAFPALSKYMEQHQNKSMITSKSQSSQHTSRSTRSSSRFASTSSPSPSAESSHKPTKRSRKKSRSGKTRHRSRSRTTDEDVKRPRTSSDDVDIHDEIKSKCDADDEKQDIQMEEQRFDPTLAIQQLLLLYQLAATIASKLLARHRDWIPCSADKCLFGFYFNASDKDGIRTCGVCQLQQHVKRVVMHLDDDFQQLIDTGIVRGCPICNEYQMRDRGMCNVMECGRCGIFWNWETRTTAHTSYELKEIARSEGSLWVPGELQYQQQLQRTNLEAFKELLARNGIAYDPNYVRGS